MITIAGLFAQCVRILVTFTRPLSYVVLDFFYGLVMGRTKPLPTIQNPILLMPAVELAEKIRKRQLSCEEVMRAYVERSKEVHPFINAAVGERYDDAIEEAKEFDLKLSTSNKSEEDIERETPLYGVPFTCKEAIGIKGMTQTCGLVREKGHVAAKDSDTAALYRKAGGIPLTVTNVPETCMWWESSNQLHGMTKNPYDHFRTTGGSSGGEGAIITAAGALIGIGNDIAGSIRIPASFCGIYGHKPSKGIISNWATYPYFELNWEKQDRSEEYVSTGPMCRYAQDLPLLVQVLSNNNKSIRLTEKVDFKRVKIYYMEEFPGILHRAVPDIKEAVRKAVSHFEETYDTKAIRLEVPELEYGFPIWECKLLEASPYPFKAVLANDPEGRICLWREFIKCLFRCSEHTWPAIFFAMVDRREKDEFYHECLQMCTSLERKFSDIFSEDAILLLPTHPEPPPHYLMTVPMYANITYTCIFSILGLASTQIPAGLSGGLPIGLQAISGRMMDRFTIAAGIELNKVFGGWLSPCKIEV